MYRNCWCTASEDSRSYVFFPVSFIVLIVRSSRVLLSRYHPLFYRDQVPRMCHCILSFILVFRIFTGLFVDSFSFSVLFSIPMFAFASTRMEARDGILCPHRLIPRSRLARIPRHARFHPVQPPLYSPLLAVSSSQSLVGLCVQGNGF